MEAELLRAISFLVPGLSKGLVYALIGLGFVLVYKCTGIFNLAVGETMVLGGYLLYLFSVQLGIPLVPAILLTLVIAAGVAFVTYRVFLQPLIGQNIISMVMVVLALGSIIVGLIILFWGSDTLFIPRLFPRGGINFANTVLSWDYIGFGAISLVLLAGLLLFFRYSRLGLSMMAISEDQQAAQALGVSVKRIIMSAWLIGILTATIGGIMLTSLTSVQYGQASLGLMGMAVALVGGLQSLVGVMVAGPLIGLIQGISAGYIDPLVPGSFQDISAFLIMLFILIFLPFGFFGWERIERV